jgi:hypothetical protein
VTQPAARTPRPHCRPPLAQKPRRRRTPPPPVRSQRTGSAAQTCAACQHAPRARIPGWGGPVDGWAVTVLWGGRGARPSPLRQPCRGPSALPPVHDLQDRLLDWSIMDEEKVEFVRKVRAGRAGTAAKQWLRDGGGRPCREACRQCQRPPARRQQAAHGSQLPAVVPHAQVMLRSGQSPTGTFVPRNINPLVVSEPTNDIPAAMEEVRRAGLGRRALPARCTDFWPHARLPGVHSPPALVPQAAAAWVPAAAVSPQQRQRAARHQDAGCKPRVRV